MKLSEIVVDSANPTKLAQFWASILDDFEVRPYDEAEIARLAKLGFTPETDPSVALDGPDLVLFFQRSEQPKNQRNRIHFDLKGGCRADEVKRLELLGATVRDVHETYTVMLDPEGNEFCVNSGEAP